MEYKTNERFYKFIKPILGLIFKLYYHPTIIGKENFPSDGAMIVAGNHIHVMDQCGPILATKRPIHYMAKKEYFDGKFAWFFRSCGCISVNRSIHDEEAKVKALQVLSEGKALGIFPEGTRNKTEAFLLPFKFGCVSMAKKMDAYIVPFAVTGEYKFRSKNLTYRIGKPFKVTNMELASANKRLEKVIRDLKNKSLRMENKK